MRHLILCLLFLSSYLLQAQSWFDNSCKNIDDKVIPEVFKTEDDRNILKIIVNQAGDIEINGVENSDLSEIQFKEYVLEFVTNPKNKKDKAVKPEKVIIQMSSYQKNTQIIDKFKSYVYDVYLYLWDQNSSEKYNTSYVDLNCRKREKIFSNFPLMIIGELEKKDKKPNGPKFGIGFPPFEGDAAKN